MCGLQCLPKTGLKEIQKVLGHLFIHFFLFSDVPLTEQTTDELNIPAMFNLKNDLHSALKEYILAT